MLGLIINPVAGLGGRVGLKGSDGFEIQKRARMLGAQSPAPGRAQAAIERLLPLGESLEIVTYAGEMGEDVVRRGGMEPKVIGKIVAGATTAEDTQAAAREMSRRGASLILFAGGDGTARDVARAVGDSSPALGIPAGVKILSGAFATTPLAAGDLARRYFEGKVTGLREVEVLDLDEEAYRAGRVSPALYGYLRVPYDRRMLQSRKSPSGPDERGTLQAIAADIVDHMEEDVAYIIGPGTTTRPILTRMGLQKTLVGVDVVCNGRLLSQDANEATLLGILETHTCKIIVTPIGGQGYLFGRGNQQISPAVLQAVGANNILVVGTPQKIHSLRGRPLLVDSGDEDSDRRLSGYVRVVTGYGERSVYRVSSSL
jgi:predicted polyphosphate/ATP-dependent NAD kinase